MRKLIAIAGLIAISLGVSAALQAQTGTQDFDQYLRLGRAPLQTEGIGRAVVVVTDQSGNPISNASVKLESWWGKDQFCESWGGTGSRGAIALNPIHMGRLKLNVKAKGFRTQKLDVSASSLNEPINVTMVRK